MDLYKSRFDAAWTAHINRHGPVPDTRRDRIIRHIHGRVLQKMRQEEEHNDRRGRACNSVLKGRETIRLRLDTWAKNTLQAEEFKAENGGRTCHGKGNRPIRRPHPFLRRLAKANGR